MVLLIYYLVVFVSVMTSVIFVTLVERKILGLIHFRLGPNSSYIKGMFQSIHDALKLMNKNGTVFFFISFIEYNIMPLGMLFILMGLWGVMPSVLFNYYNVMLMILCLMSASVYPIMFGSWFSGSLYSMLGSIRSISQMISYEVSLIMIFMSLIYFLKSFDLTDFSLAYINVFPFFLLVLTMLFITILAELGRSPIDLLEGESELVSGFNTEYFGFKFAFIFLSEYGMIMFMSGLVSSMGFGLSFFSLSWLFFFLLFVLLIILVRSILPRVRYDKLMIFCWISMLNMSLGVLIINVGVVALFTCL